MDFFCVYEEEIFFASTYYIINILYEKNDSFLSFVFFGSMTSAFDDTQVDFYKHSIEALSER